MLPQVLAGLGAVSLVSVGCIVWLQRLQPLFVALSAGALTYQLWLVWRLPASRRTRKVRGVLWASLATTMVVSASVFALWVRYR